MKRRDLTPEEKKLWEQVKSSVQPLSAEDVKMWGYEDVKITKLPIVKKETANPPLLTSSYLHIPTQGSYAGIDRNTAERFRKGKTPIDATLDLHGMSREEAFVALYGFVRAHYVQGSRCLLVITGKGEILRELLPRWLAEADLRPVVLTFDTAQPKHGGSGAFYVLLKRKR